MAKLTGSLGATSARQLCATGGTIRRNKRAKPGTMVYTDQLVSSQSGLVPQEKGSPMRARIWGATIFVDSQIEYTKVHLMQDATGKSTLEAKAAFEQGARSRGICRYPQVPRGQWQIRREHLTRRLQTEIADITLLWGWRASLEWYHQGQDKATCLK